MVLKPLADPFRNGTANPVMSNPIAAFVHGRRPQLDLLVVDQMHVSSPYPRPSYSARSTIFRTPG
jgi:hypothetical protein